VQLHVLAESRTKLPSDKTSPSIFARGEQMFSQTEVSPRFIAGGGSKVPQTNVSAQFLHRVDQSSLINLPTPGKSYPIQLLPQKKSLPYYLEILAYLTIYVELK